MNKKIRCALFIGMGGLINTERFLQKKSIIPVQGMILFFKMNENTFYSTLNSRPVWVST